MTPESCLWCDRPGDYLCDHAIGRVRPDAEQLELAAANPPHGGHSLDSLAPITTCDAPMCRRHAYQVGHICKRGGKGKGCDSIDMCEFHTGGLSGEDARRQLTPMHVAEFRRRMRSAVSGGNTGSDVEEFYE